MKTVVSHFKSNTSLLGRTWRSRKTLIENELHIYTIRKGIYENSKWYLEN